MAKKKRKKSTSTKKEISIRKTKEWQKLKKAVAEGQANFPTREDFYKYIDKLYNMDKIDQHNILGSFKKYKGGMY
jgi:hypothetical protein